MEEKQQKIMTQQQDIQAILSTTEDKIKELQEGNRIILWTARTGQKLDDAIAICESVGLVFDEIAKDKPDADLFIDDKALTIEDV